MDRILIEILLQQMSASESAWRFATTVRQHSVQESNCYRGKDINQPTNQTSQRNIPLWVLGNSQFWGEKVKGQSHESQRHCRRGSLHSYECWLLLVLNLFADIQIWHSSLYHDWPETYYVWLRSLTHSKTFDQAGFYARPNSNPKLHY